MTLESKLDTQIGGFDVAAYVMEARLKGRLNLSVTVRQQAARLYEDLTATLKSDGRYLSLESRRAADLATRVLEPEAFFQYQLARKGRIVPRYVWYTNVRVLKQLAGMTHGPLGPMLNKIGRAASIVLADLRRFESDSLSGREQYVGTNYDRSLAERRLSQIDKLAAVVTPRLAAEELALGSTPLRSFAEYARGGDDLALAFLTAFPQTTEHDEYLFLRTIHLQECSFWSVLLCVREALGAIYGGELQRTRDLLLRASDFAAILVPAFQLLATMPPTHFEGFRDETGESSAIQSRGYQLLDALMRGLDARKVEDLRNTAEVADVLKYRSMYFTPLLDATLRIDDKAPLAQEVWDLTNDLFIRVYSAMKFHENRLADGGYLPSAGGGTGGTMGLPYLREQTLPRPWRGQRPHTPGGFLPRLIPPEVVADALLPPSPAILDEPVSVYAE